MKRADQAGHSVVEVLLAVVAVGILGFTGWYVYHSRQISDNATTPPYKRETKVSTSKLQPPANTVNAYAGWIKITSSTYGMSFYYPSGWYVVSYNSAGNALNGASPNASEYAIYARKPVNGIENDACVSVAGGSAYNKNDFKSGSVVAKLGNKLEVWQNSVSDDGFATAYLVTVGKQLVQLSGSKTVVVSAALSCGQGMNVNLSGSQQLANADYQTAVKILKSVTLN